MGAALVASGWSLGADGIAASPGGRTSDVPSVASPTSSRSPVAALEPAAAPAAAADGSADAVVEPLPTAAPARLRIPAIGVDTALMALGLRPDGVLEVPPEGFPAGWYTGSPAPGERGPAILAGHVDWEGRPGVFSDLHLLARGDEVAVGREDGSTARFRVSRVERYPKDRFPTEAVYGDLDHAGLRLITCGGSFDRGRGSYEDNVVVFAELVGTEVP